MAKLGENVLRRARTLGRIMWGGGKITLRNLNLKVQPPCIVSFDVFATLIERTLDEHYALRASAAETARVASAHGLEPPADPVAYRRQIERAILRERRRSGAPTEFSNQIIIERMLRGLGGEEWATEAAQSIARYELDEEIRTSRPRRAVLNILKQHRESGRKIIAVSDTRYSEMELRCLLNANGIEGMDSIYSSSDFGVSKREGLLFGAVSASEGVSASSILHIGDNIISDILVASGSGLSVQWVRQPRPPKALPSAPAQPRNDAGFRLGYDVIGPCLVAFNRILFADAAERGISRLAFVARDGYLPLQIAKVLTENAKNYPELAYISLSRRLYTSATIDFRRIADNSVELDDFVFSICTLGGDSNLINRMQGYTNLPAEIVDREARRLDLKNFDEIDLRRLLSDRDAASEFAAASAGAGEILSKYLEQEDVFSQHTALVDIGWRGSVHKAVANLAEQSDRVCPHTYLLGYWDAPASELPNIERLTGVISDMRRRRALREGAPFYARQLLEAICKADHGTTTGLSATADGICPVWVETGVARRAELDFEDSKSTVHEGALAYARWFAENLPLEILDAERVRREAQTEFFKLAFYPRPHEREIGRKISHTEPTDDEHATALIHVAGRGFRGWVEGIRSPWKGAYFKETMGLPGAFGYCLLELILSRLTPSQFQMVRGLVYGSRT